MTLQYLLNDALQRSDSEVLHPRHVRLHLLQGKSITREDLHFQVPSVSDSPPGDSNMVTNLERTQIPVNLVEDTAETLCHVTKVSDHQGLGGPWAWTEAGDGSVHSEHNWRQRTGS